MRAIITAQQPKSRGGPSRPPTHVAHYVWPQRLKRRARSARPLPRLWALNGPVPYLVSATLERSEPQVQKT
jgi:hypothetical protein